uniref:C2H2-type domain-containing protein n=1 Tax=Cyprinus carpio carpio TaxID=630221 RepID=A0A9J7YHD7_CYPCA
MGFTTHMCTRPCNSQTHFYMNIPSIFNRTTILLKASLLQFSAPDITRTVSFFSRCEVCGFTCRQKASLNWHMRKHNAESTYQFPCEICGRRFEKRDNVTVHRSKSHPDYDTPTPELTLPLLPSDPLPHPLEHSRSSPSASKNHTAVE